MFINHLQCSQWNFPVCYFWLFMIKSFIIWHLTFANDIFVPSFWLKSVGVVIWEDLEVKDFHYKLQLTAVVLLDQVNLLKSFPLRLYATYLTFTNIPFSTSLDWTNVSFLILELLFYLLWPVIHVFLSILCFTMDHLAFFTFG